MRRPEAGEEILVVYAREFQPEGDDCDARLLCEAYVMGWKSFIVYGYKGQRFTGNGFGPNTKDVRIDVYGSSGDYLASGIDGMEIHVHGNAQDQLGQIMKHGKLVIFGDVGQTFMYGAKGGDGLHHGQCRRPAPHQCRGKAPGRHQRHGPGLSGRILHGRRSANGGGFVILNGMAFDDEAA